jgi:hypothetical protein
LDITLEIGALEETITVTGESPLIETTNASTGDLLDTRALESIPSAGRSVFLMANLTPTVQTSGNAHWNRMQIRSATRRVDGRRRRPRKQLSRRRIPGHRSPNRASTTRPLSGAGREGAGAHLRRRMGAPAVA